MSKNMLFLFIFEQNSKPNFGIIFLSNPVKIESLFIYFSFSPQKYQLPYTI